MTVIRKESWEIRNRMSELGIEEERLRDVVRRGYLAYATCTENHPRFIRGIWAWAETVRALREYLMPLGWQRSDDNNYSLAIDPSDDIAIAVATGDEGTGREEMSPTTKTPKGPNTVEAVTNNQFSFEFAEVAYRKGPEPEADTNKERATWILLLFRASNEVRCEISLPSSIGPDGKIDGWTERILLRPIPLDGDSVKVAPPTQPDIVVEVKRRA